MSRDATGIWSGLATERIACPVCKAEVGQVCDLSDMTLESTNGTHLDRIDAYGQIHNTFDVSKPLDLKPCPFCATTQSDVPDTVVTITNDVGRTCVFCLKCEACGPIADEVDQDFDEREEAAAVAKWNAAVVRTDLARAEAKIAALLEAWDAMCAANAAWSPTGPQSCRDAVPVARERFHDAIRAARGEE